MAPGLFFDEDLVGSAGQVDRQAAVPEILQQPTGPMDEQVVGLDCLLPQPVEPILDPQVEPTEVFVLVPERFPGLAAPLANSLGELDHLVDGLLAVEVHDVLEGHPGALGRGLTRQCGEDFGEHRHHDLGPALADQRQRPVEVEQDVADPGPSRERGLKEDLTGELGHHRAGTPNGESGGWLIVAADRG